MSPPTPKQKANELVTLIRRGARNENGEFYEIRNYLDAMTPEEQKEVFSISTPYWGTALETAILAEYFYPTSDYPPVRNTQKNIELFDLLISYGAPLNISDNADSFSPLHVAAKSGNLPLVKKLMERCGERVVSVKGPKGRTPLYSALRTEGNEDNDVLDGKKEVIKYLLSCGADHTVDAEGNTLEKMIGKVPESASPRTVVQDEQTEIEQPTTITDGSSEPENAAPIAFVQPVAPPSFMQEKVLSTVCRWFGW